MKAGLLVSLADDDDDDASADRISCNMAGSTMYACGSKVVVPQVYWKSDSIVFRTKIIFYGDSAVFENHSCC